MSIQNKQHNTLTVTPCQAPLRYHYPDGYNGFYTEDPAEFETYKSELIAEAMNDGIGCTWNEVRQQIRESHPSHTLSGTSLLHE